MKVLAYLKRFIFTAIMLSLAIQPALSATLPGFSLNQLPPVHSSSIHNPKTNLPLKKESEVKKGRNNTAESTKNLQQIAQWIKVPDWLSGSWQSENQTIIAAYDYRKKEALKDLPQKIAIKRLSKIGSQKDRESRVWHLGAPNSRIIETANYTEYQTIESIKQVFESPTAFAIKTKAVISRVSKDGNELLDAFKEETSTSYTPICDGLILSDFQINDFDLQGKAIFSSKSMCIEKRVKNFEQVDEDSRGNLKVIFHEFLLDSGLMHLIP